MFYLLYGPNSYKALRKIREFKEVFFRKGGADFLVEEIDGSAQSVGVAGVSFSDIAQTPLFSKRRLVILKDVLSDKVFQDLLGANIGFLKDSPDIFVFWERDPKKSEGLFQKFKKSAEKVQVMENLSAKELDFWLEKKAGEVGLKLSREERAVMIEKAGGEGEWMLENELEKMALSKEIPASLVAAGGGFVAKRQSRESGINGPPARSGISSSPFAFVEKIFWDKGGEAILTFKKAVSAGHIPEKFIYPLLWKAKQKHMIDVYKNGILTESAMRRNPKNAYEILERFILSTKA